MRELDINLNAYREDLADVRLKSLVVSENFVEPRLAIVQKGEVPVYSSKDQSKCLATYLHYGESVDVFEDTEGVAWVQSRLDSYVGYVPSKCIRYLSGTKFIGNTYWIKNQVAFAYNEPDLKSVIHDVLPRLSKVTVAGDPVVTRDTPYVQIETGAFLAASALCKRDRLSNTATEAAIEYLGAPYKWGGRSFLGIDCSGLIQAVYHSLGLKCPRDTYMQKDFFGTESIESVDDLAGGEILFFDQHVVLVTPDRDVIHADGEKMKVVLTSIENLATERKLDGTSCEAVKLSRSIA